MPRRKRHLLDDGDSDSSAESENGDFELESNNLGGELPEDLYQRKRRRKNGEDNALYGIFAEDSEDDRPSGLGREGQKKRSDWTKAPAFVSGDKVDMTKSTDEGEEEKGDVGDEVENDENSNDEDTSEGDKESIPTPARSSPSPPASDAFPSTFSNSRTQRSFIRTKSPMASNRPATPLSAAEQAHFNKLQGTFGARMLAKMGWQAGTGLGTTGDGIVTPVDQKQRPQKMGIAYKGFKEKTEQSKAEARRRGEVISDDEDEKRPKRGGKSEKEQGKKSDAWKRPKKVKTKVEHKTYEQIVAEAGQDLQAGIGVIIDATGATPREVSSLADVSLSSWTPSTDPTRIPEVRHNLRLIADACKTDLDGLAREAKAFEERKRWHINEDARLRKKVEEEAVLISRLQQVHLVIDDINTQSKELTSVYEATLEPFSPLFHKLLEKFSREFDRYHLDEIVVAAIAPLVRRMVAQWKPLEDPTAFISTFQEWKQALKLTHNEEKPQQAQIDIYGAKTNLAPTQVENPMTPFESLLWNVWLPKVRTCINNDWSPRDAQPAVRLYETWSSFLPLFIRDSILDQLILPKVQKAIADWNPQKDNVPLQALVFPWLPHVGLRLEDVIADARRKVKGALRSWVVGKPIPMDLITWRDVFNPGEWDVMLLQYVVPKLGATLRNDFRVNPRDQTMEPLEQVLLWSSIIRPSIFSQILETEFFPKWLDVLHVWLIQPRVSFEEVAQWYTFWKGTFPETVQNMAGVSRGLTRGLQLMNKALELGPEAPTRLPRPDHRVEHIAPGHVPPKTRQPARTYEITFRSIVEEFAASHNLLFMPTGRAHEISRMPLFRVSPTADGKGGLLIYILDDAVWAPGDGEEYRAITLDDMVARAGL